MLDLKNLKAGRTMRPPKMVVYGGPKVGKTTFGSQAPNPIFIPLEQGLDALSVAATPTPKDFDEFMSFLREIAGQEHEFKSIVIDSADWLQPLIWAKVAKDNKVGHIDDIPYYKGYNIANPLWRSFLDGLDYLRDKIGMCVLVLAHDEKKTMTPPDGQPYDYAALKLHKHAAAMLEEWADITAYATEKRLITKDGQGFNQHNRAALKGERVLVTGLNPAYVTGSRYALPDEIPLNFQAFQNEFNKI